MEEELVGVSVPVTEKELDCAVVGVSEFETNTENDGVLVTD